MSAIALVLGVPFPTTLNSGQQRLFQVDVPAGQTLKVTATARDRTSTMQLFASAGVAPTTTLFDASSGGALGATQTAVVPTTQPGTYYILLDSFTMPVPGEPVTIEAQLVPLAITDVHTDTGGDTKFVTTTISGAGFNAQAVVKLVRPGFQEIEPVLYRVVDATKIIAEFDFTAAIHGLYDLLVLNPDGNQAIVPYRFLITQTVEPEVTIGVGGPRYIFAGDTGTYSVALQNLGNIDAPYTYFSVGVPEIPQTGTNIVLDNLPYLAVESNVAGGPLTGSQQNLPWATLDSNNNINGENLTSGYLLNEAAAGFTGFTFNVDTYPGLKALNDHAWDNFKSAFYAAEPQFAAQDFLKDGPQDLDKIQKGLSGVWDAFGAAPAQFQIPAVPFEFNIVASATSMTRPSSSPSSLPWRISCEPASSRTTRPLRRFIPWPPTKPPGRTCIWPLSKKQAFYCRTAPRRRFGPSRPLSAPSPPWLPAFWSGRLATRSSRTAISPLSSTTFVPGTAIIPTPSRPEYDADRL